MANFLYLLQRFERFGGAWQNLPENRMFLIQVLAFTECYVELRAIRVRTAVCHGEKTSFVVDQAWMKLVPETISLTI